MKKISKILMMLLLIGALGAGMVLVRRNQETRRGATAAETSTSILPSEISVQPGDDFKVNLLVNTGKDTDKLTGVEMTVSYDAAKLKYDSITVDATSGYSLLNDVATIDDGAGKLTINMVAMGTEKAGAINLAKLNFKALGGGSGTIKVSTAKVLVSGQASTWDVSKHDASVIKMDGPLSTAMPVDPTVTPKITAILPAVTATIGPKPTVILPVITPSTKCNSRCQKDADCGSGMICKPLWWSCEKPIPTGIVSSIQNKELLTSGSVDKLVSVCPDVEKVLISSSTSPGSKVAPSSMGMCRNVKCIDDLDCDCSGGEPRITPTRGPIGTPVPGSSAKIDGSFEATNYQLTDKVKGGINIAAKNGKISGVDIKVSFSANKVSLESVSVGSSIYSVLKKDIDNVNGRLALSLTASHLSADLLNNLKIGLIFNPKEAGKVAMSLDGTYANMITGVNTSGQSISFSLVPGVWGSTEILAGGLPVPACKECKSGPAKGKGNANCDAKVDLLDFEYWRNDAYDKGGLKQARDGVTSPNWDADFNCNGMVELIEFEIWRRTVYP